LLPKQAQELLRGSFKLFEELKVPTSEPLSNENTVTWSPTGIPASFCQIIANLNFDNAWLQQFPREN
jgi:hypothetical protein